MPVSPFQRGAEENTSEDVSAVGDATSSPTGEPTGHVSGKARKRQRQRARARERKAREQAQLTGVTPTVPEMPQQGGVSSVQPEPRLVESAIRRGWAVPEAKKPELVDHLVSLLDDPEASPKTKVAAFSALRQADQVQWERDNPKQASQVVPTTNVAVSVSTAPVAAVVDAVRELILSGDLGRPSNLLPPAEPGALGDGGQQREVEAGGAPAGDQRYTGNGVANGKQPHGSNGALPARQEPPE